MPTPIPNRLALALSGGGAKCAAQAGVIDVLEEAALPVGAATGASGGALVAVLYGLGLSPAAIRDYIADTHLLEVWEFDPARRAIFGSEKIRARLHCVVRDKTFTDLKIPVTVISVDLKSGCEIRLNSGRLDEALLATMAVPGLFTPLISGHRVMIDGAALNPLPVDVARTLGIRVVAVDVLHHQPPSGQPVQLFETRGPMRYATQITTRLGLTELLESVHQTTTLMTCRLSEYNLQACPPDVLIRPEVGCIGLFAFDLARDAYQLGRDAALAALPQLQALGQIQASSITKWRNHLSARWHRFQAQRKPVTRM